MTKPTQIDVQDIDLTQLVEICQEYLDFIEKAESDDENDHYPHVIYEKAIIAIFGDQVFDYINSNLI